jgi:hypothetical protein
MGAGLMMANDVIRLTISKQDVAGLPPVDLRHAAP